MQEMKSVQVKKMMLVLNLVLFIMLVKTGSAVTVGEEFTGYTAGTLDGQGAAGGGWVGAWGNGGGTVVNGTLGTINTVASVAPFAQSTGETERNLTTAISGDTAVYVYAIIGRPGGGNPGGDFGGIGFYNSGGGEIGLIGEMWNTTNDWAINDLASGVVIDAAPRLICVKINQVTNNVDIWVDPDFSQPESTIAPNASGSRTINDIARIRIRGNITVEVDNITIMHGGDSPFAPEPFRTDLNGPDPGGDYAATYNESGGAVNITSNTAEVVSIGNLTQMTCTITNPVPASGDVLDATLSGGVTGKNFTNNILTLTGNASAADYQAVLRTLTFDTNDPPEVHTRTVEVVGSNGGGSMPPTLSAVTINRTTPIDIISDEFIGYSGGATLAGNNGGTGWSSAWTDNGGDATVTIGTMGTVNTISSSGPYLQVGVSATTNFSRSLSTISGETAVYCYGLMRVPGGGVSGSQFGGIGLFEGGTERFLIGEGWPGDVWALAGPGFQIPTTIPIDTNTHLICAKFNQVTGLGSIWVDPDFSQPESAQAADATGTHPNISNPFDAVRVRSGNNGHTFDFDNLVVMHNGVSPFASEAIEVDFNGPVASINYATTFVEGSGSVGISTDTATVSSAVNLTTMVVTLLNPRDGANESLDATLSGGVTGKAYVNGVLTLTGDAPASDYQTVLRTVVYDNTTTSPNVVTRIIRVQASNSLASSIVAETLLSIDAALNPPCQAVDDFTSYTGSIESEDGGIGWGTAWVDSDSTGTAVASTDTLGTVHTVTSVAPYAIVSIENGINGAQAGFSRKIQTTISNDPAVYIYALMRIPSGASATDQFAGIALRNDGANVSQIIGERWAPNDTWELQDSGNDGLNSGLTIDNQTHLICIKINQQNGEAKIWVDPNFALSEGFNTPQDIQILPGLTGDFNEIWIRCGNNDYAVHVDNLTVLFNGKTPFNDTIVPPLTTPVNIPWEIMN